MRFLFQSSRTGKIKKPREIEAFVFNNSNLESSELLLLGGFSCCIG